ncbi:MAG: hypothetical protein CSA50_07965 [Gammaproteobacteria bacterium]|nr:MAG: hypothetical protein CSA50_07965 [Gammaproteobacteria bacterium]
MSDENVLVLEKSMGITNAEALANSLTQLFGAGAAVSIDAAGVERIDTATVQLIYSFVSSMQQSGVRVEISEPSEAFLSGVSCLGFASHLGFEVREQ